MSKRLLIDAHYKDEKRIAVIDEESSGLEHYEAESAKNRRIKGNIYLAKIIRIEPALQAAFIDYGEGRNGFLSFADIKPDYYNKNITEAGNPSQDYKIQEVISQKQVLLVQAIKDVRGHKSAAFSTYVTIPGRYCVLLSSSMENKQGGGGVSKKIPSAEKVRLKEILASLEIPEKMSIIIRTAGENRTKLEIKRDFDYLMRLWNEITQKAISSNAPLLIFEEGNLVQRAIRDLYSKEVEEVLVEGDDAYKEARTFMKLYTPSHVKKIKKYEDSTGSLFDKYDIDSKAERMMDTSVSLPSGGSIVINQTEALTAIDVNSGRAKQERNIDDMALRTNLEAAAEVAKQLRLRDLSGLIVIDFIDMSDSSYVARVEKKLKEAVKFDSSHIQLGRISQFGLLELSRQRSRASISEINFVQCTNCCGTGKVMSNDVAATVIMRKIENFAAKESSSQITVRVPEGIDVVILNAKRRQLIDFENKWKCQIEVFSSSILHGTECELTSLSSSNEESKKLKFIPKKQNEVKTKVEKVAEAPKAPKEKPKEKKIDKPSKDFKLIIPAEPATTPKPTQKPKKKYPNKKKKIISKKSNAPDTASSVEPSEPLVEKKASAAQEKQKPATWIKKIFLQE